jgi:Ribonuclease G/E
MAVIFPALAHLVTVLGSTLNNLATSEGVKSTSDCEDLEFKRHSQTEYTFVHYYPNCLNCEATGVMTADETVILQSISPLKNA